MFRRGNVYWAQNNEIRKQESLQTKDRPTALRLLNTRSEAQRQSLSSFFITNPVLRSRNFR